jgi:y4mF family transcriptional regulator
MIALSSAKTLGTELRAARKRMRLTQPELALAAGVGVRFIVDLEGGKSTVRLEQVLRVIDALGGTLALTGLAPVSPQAQAGGHGE